MNRLNRLRYQYYQIAVIASNPITLDRQTFKNAVKLNHAYDDLIQAIRGPQPYRGDYDDE